MRVLLDTNILVRAAGNSEGLAGRLLEEVVSGPHVLVVSPYLLSEIPRVLGYPRLQLRWRLTPETIAEFVSRIADVAETVLTTTPDPVVIADPDDDPIVQTAVFGKVDFLCTRDRHLFEKAVIEYCDRHSIRIIEDIALYHILTERISIADQ
jgi:uncharacterized protein